MIVDPRHEACLLKQMSREESLLRSSIELYKREKHTAVEIAMSFTLQVQSIDSHGRPRDESFRLIFQVRVFSCYAFSTSCSIP